VPGLLSMSAPRAACRAALIAAAAGCLGYWGSSHNWRRMNKSPRTIIGCVAAACVQQSVGCCACSMPMVCALLGIDLGTCICRILSCCFGEANRSAQCALHLNVAGVTLLCAQSNMPHMQGQPCINRTFSDMHDGLNGICLQ
jgi:hypothetical protein